MNNGAPKFGFEPPVSDCKGIKGITGMARDKSVAVVLAAGGAMAAADGTPLSYGHGERDYRVPGFIAWGDPRAAKASGYGTSLAATSGQ